MDVVREIINFWFLQSLAIGLTAFVIPGLRITGLSGLFAASAILAIINATVWDAALFFSVPAVLDQQALVLFLMNGALFWILVKLLPGIEVSGILPALVAPLALTIVSYYLNKFGGKIDWLQLGGFIADGIATLRATLLGRVKL